MMAKKIKKQNTYVSPLNVLAHRENAWYARLPFQPCVGGLSSTTTSVQHMCEVMIDKGQWW